MKLSMLCVLLLVSSFAYGQQVILDQPVRAGELTLFPSHQNEDVYYYVIDKARLATDESGRPQFSLLRYVSNVRSGADEAEAEVGEGGAILHALVTLEVTEDQLREAQRALNRVRPGAEIEGPIVYESGRFALISAFADEQGELTEQVLGVGSAPILDGQKAAVSLLLSREGSKILWQSFHTPTPDISFSFEMEMKGYRSPQQGVIEANFDQIYEYDAFNVGLASSYLSAEIKGAFEDLTRSGAIKVTQVGDDSKIEELLDVAYRKLTEAMFEPVGTNSPTIASLTQAASGQQSMLDRATAQLTQSRQEARQENQRIRRENAAERARVRAEQDTAQAGSASSPTPNNGSDESSNSSNATATSEPASESETDENDERPAQRYSQAQPADPEQRVAGDTAASQSQPQLQEEQAVPAFAIVASYEMKRVRQRGNWRIDLNKYTADSLTLRFDENIGDLRSFLGDEAHFRQVNLDDPLYRQREISVFLDGMNAGDFGEYINFVTVQLRKQHESGEPSYDETRIDRRNFNAEGNAFKLLYGWKGDNDRDEWLNYDYRTRWSFHGGFSFDSEWQPANFGAINLAPRVARRQLQVEADPNALEQNGVRAVMVKIFYQLGDSERVEQITLNPSRGVLSAVVDYLAPTDAYQYDYEVTWVRRGQPSLNSGRRSATEAILFVDELPEV